MELALISTHTDNTENASTGLRPMRSATMPQKTDAIPLPIMYDAPEEEEDEQTSGIQ